MTKKKDKIKTESLVVALIDETGSMAIRRGETITAYNAYITELQKDKKTDTTIQTFKFDKYAQEPVLRPLTPEPQAISNAASLNWINYVPRGMTPLYDAIGQAFTFASKHAPASGRVTVMIQTDGAENSSVEFSYVQIRELIDIKQRAGWNILFLAADLQAQGYSMAQHLGVTTSNTMSYAGSNSKEAFASAAIATSSYNAGGTSRGFSIEQKRKSGDNVGQ